MEASINAKLMNPVVVVPMSELRIGGQSRNANYLAFPKESPSGRFGNAPVWQWINP